jgi:hypothetical protein
VGHGHGESNAFGPVLRSVNLLFRVSERASPAFWLRKPFTNYQEDRDTRFFGSYVLIWLVILIAILARTPVTGNWALACAALALYRLQDLIFGTVGDAFNFNGAEIKSSWRSKVMLAVVNIVQIVVIFAIVFLVLTPRHAFHPTAPSSRFGHFFLSWSTLPPLGSGFSALTTRSRVLVMIESGAGVVMTVVALSRFLAINSDPPTAACPAAAESAPEAVAPGAPAKGADASGNGEV